MPTYACAAVATMSLSPGWTRADPLQDYAQQCTQAIGTTIPDFDCDAGTEVPVTNAHGSSCDRPNRLNQECDPGSKFQVLTRSDTAYVVAHCRKKGNAAGEFGDIAIIQYSRTNGATCFYQALGTLPGHVKSPSKGGNTWPWISPAGTASIRCGHCHDNGPFIRSPYINQVTGPNALPGADDFSFNSDQPYAFVGSDFAGWKAYKVEVAGNECNGCHRLGANNLDLLGTAIDFAVRATAASEVSKNPPSAASPIWMPPVPVQTALNQAHANSAKAIHDCAMHVRDVPLPNSNACRITQYAAAFVNLPPVVTAGSLNQFASAQFGLNHQTDVFLTDAAGALRVTWVVDAGHWAVPAQIGPSGRFPKGAAVAASKQFGLDNQTDIWAVDKSGALNVAWVVKAGAWNGPVAISPNGRFAPGAPVAASNQFGLDNQTDVFAVDQSGALNVSWVVNAGHWSGPAAISPNGRFPSGASVAASRQFGIDHQTDVFAVDNNGSLTVAWVVDAGHWNPPVSIGAPGQFRPGAAVVASNQFGLAQQTDVFAIDKSGALTVAWVVDGGHWNGPVAISPPGRFPSGAPLAVSRQFGLDNQTDVFAVDNSGTLNVAWAVEGGHWNGPAPVGQAGRFAAGAPIAASNQFSLDNQTDVFAVDKNAILNVAWVVDAGHWSGPVPIQ